MRAVPRQLEPVLAKAARAFPAVAIAIKDLPAFVDAFPLDDFYCPPEDEERGLAAEWRAAVG